MWPIRAFCVTRKKREGAWLYSAVFSNDNAGCKLTSVCLRYFLDQRAMVGF